MEMIFTVALTLYVVLMIASISFGMIVFVCYLVWCIGPVGRIISITFYGWFIYSIYGTVFPYDDFYKGEFVRVTGLKFPVSGKILEKYASFPDMHGDYGSCALIQVSESDYESLKQHLKSVGAREDIPFSWGCIGSSDQEPDAKFLYLKEPKRSRSETKVWGLLKGSNIVYIDYANY